MAQEKAANIIDLNAPREALGPAQAQSAGDFLAASRRSAGTSLATVSAATNVKIEHLEAIEATNAAALPATVYAIGFVKVYAQFLGLDAESVAKQFKKDIGADASEIVAPIHDVAPSSPHIGEGARMVSIFGIIAILIFVFWIVIQITGNPGDGERVQVATDQPVRLGATPIAAPELRPRSTVPATVTVSPPVNDKPVVEETVERTAADPVPNRSVTTEPLSSQPAPQVLSSETAAPEELGNDAVELETVTVPETSDMDLAGVDALSAEPVVDTLNSDVSSLLASPPATEIPSTEPSLLSSIPVEAPNLAPVPLIVNATLTRSIAPRYPNQCTRNAAPLEAVTVVFDVTIKGRAANARVVQTSNACFDDAAMATIRRWRFDPKTVDGVARPDIGKQATLNFRR